MSSYYGDVMTSTGEYQDANGQTKKRWLKVGAAFVDDNKNLSFKLDALPMPKEGGCWLKVFKKDSQPQNNPPQQQQQQPQQQNSGDIPF